jgi:mannose PTS system EIIA component
MIGILIIAHGSLGESLIECATHVLGARPPMLEQLDVSRRADDPADLLETAQNMVRSLDGGDGVLVLSDIFGATPCNTATRLLNPGKVEGVAGVNLPMLMRLLTYRNEPLEKALEKALSGGREGVLRVTAQYCDDGK